MYDLVLTLFFSSFILAIPRHVHFFLPLLHTLSLLPYLVSQSLFPLVVVVSVRPRWRAAKLPLHYQRVASQSLSYLKWKAEHRLRVIDDFSLKPRPGQAIAGVPWVLYPQTSSVLPELRRWEVAREPRDRKETCTSSSEKPLTGRQRPISELSAYAQVWKKARNWPMPTLQCTHPLPNPVHYSSTAMREALHGFAGSLCFSMVGLSRDP